MRRQTREIMRKLPMRNDGKFSFSPTFTPIMGGSLHFSKAILTFKNVEVPRRLTKCLLKGFRGAMPSLPFTPVFGLFPPPPPLLKEYMT